MFVGVELTILTLRGFVVVCFLSLLSTICAAQNSKDSNEVAAFRTGTRVVLVDIVATDSSGKPIHGLKAEDFQIFDNGKRQTIRAFDEHTPDEAVAASYRKQPVLGPGIYSNWVPAPPSNAVNIILFDTLNIF